MHSSVPGAQRREHGPLRRLHQGWMDGVWQREAAGALQGRTRQRGQGKKYLFNRSFDRPGRGAGAPSHASNRPARVHPFPRVAPRLKLQAETSELFSIMSPSMQTDCLTTRAGICKPMSGGRIHSEGGGGWRRDGPCVRMACVWRRWPSAPTAIAAHVKHLVRRKKKEVKPSG